MLALLTYHKLRFFIPFKYFRIFLTTFKCDLLGHDRNVSQTHTLCMISEQLVVK